MSTILDNERKGITDSSMGEKDRRRWYDNKITTSLWQVVILSSLLGTWQVMTVVGWLDATFVSRPTDAFYAFWTGITRGNYLELLGETLYEVFGGFLLAVAAGLLVGGVLAEHKAVDMLTRPFILAANNVPRIALAPLFVLWFGLGPASRIVLVFTLSFFIVTLNTKAGLESADRDRLLLARVLGASVITRFVKFVLPGALPTMLSGIQLALTYAFLGAVAGEMLAGSAGLGGFLAQSLNTLSTDQFFGALLLLLLVSLFVSVSIDSLFAYFLRWRRVDLRGVE